MSLVISIEEMRADPMALIRAAKHGQQVVITDGDVPFAAVVPLSQPPERKFGALKEQFAIGREFFDPLPEDELALWE